MTFFIENSHEGWKSAAFPQIIDDGHDKVDCGENTNRTDGNEGEYNPCQPFGPCGELKIPPIKVVSVNISKVRRNCI